MTDNTIKMSIISPREKTVKHNRDATGWSSTADITVAGIPKPQIKLLCFVICDYSSYLYQNRKLI